VKIPRQNLRTPGPTPCPPEVLEAVGGAMINHRGPEFKELLYRVSDRLRQVFDTEGDVYILTSSGTGAMEAAVANTLSPGDKVLCVSIGSFGDRFGQIARVFGADVTMLSFPPGTAADPGEVRKALRADPGISAVLVTHNETNTGVTNDLEAIAAVVKGEQPKPFHYKPQGMFCLIGHRNAVGQVYSLRVSGLLAWFLWHGIYWAKMPTVGRKVQIAVDWIWDLFFPPDIVELSTDQTSDIEAKHGKPS